MGEYSKHVALSRVFSVAEDIVDEEEALLAYYHDELQEFKNTKIRYSAVGATLVTVLSILGGAGIIVAIFL